MLAFVFGIGLFAAVCAAALTLGFVAHRKTEESLHQSLRTHSSYVRFMQDKHDLNKFGYAQQLMRRQGGFASFGSSFLTMSSAGGAVLLLGPATSAGGAAVVGFGWPLLSLLGLFTACSLAALASAIPTSGGCYHWAAALGGRRLGLSAGWLHISGNIVLFATTNMLCASWLNRIAAITFGYELSTVTYGLLLIGLFAAQAAVGQLGSGSLAKLFSAVSWLKVLLVVGVIGALAASSWPGILPGEALFDFPAKVPSQPGGTSPELSFPLGILLLQRMFLGSETAAMGAEEKNELGFFENRPTKTVFGLVYCLNGMVCFFFLIKSRFTV